MALLIKIAALWLSFDIVVIATVWYASRTLPALWPEWWKQKIINGDE